MRRHLIAGVCAALLTLPGAASAAGGSHPLPDIDFSFEGPFGKFDQAQLQRGFQVYKEVCSSCHGAYFMYYRDLAKLGYSEDEIKAVAAQYSVMDGPDDNGEMFERPARPSDNFWRPFPNEAAARAANLGAYPVDLSMIVDARAGGASYVYSILTEYQDEPPEGVELLPGQYYTPAKGVIAMAPPLWPDFVEYADGTEATVSQMSQDVAAFLAFAAEPNMEERKSLGAKVMIFLLVFTILFYLVKRKIWADVKH